MVKKIMMIMKIVCQKKKTPELGDGGGHRDPPLRPAPGAAGGPGAHGHAAGRKREGVIYCRKSATYDAKAVTPPHGDGVTA